MSKQRGERPRPGATRLDGVAKQPAAEEAADGGAAGAVALRPFIILADSAVAALVRPADAAIAALTSEELAVCVAKVGEGDDSAAYSRFCGALGAVFAALC